MSRQLTHILFWVAAAACALAELAIVRAALATHSRRAPAEGVPQPSRIGEIIWVVIPALALAVVLWATWRALP